MSEAQKNRLFLVAVGAIAALGLALRIAGARGDLWVDEVWSLKLLQQIKSPDQIFWKINHDNNHYLNSLWMYELGPFRSSLAYRAPAVVLGTATVIAAGVWGRRRGRVAAIVAMLLFAASYMQVDLSSQARGYAGLTLAIVLAFLLTEDALNGKRRGLDIGLACLFGVLSHFLMFFCIAVIAAWGFLTRLERNEGFWRSCRATILLFLPAAILILPIFAWVMFTVVQHEFVIGFPQPFTGPALFAYFGRTINASVALPLVDGAMAYTYMTLFAVMAYCSDRSSGDNRRRLYIIAVLALPAMLFLCQVPNTSRPRYFIVPAAALMLMLADMAGREWRSGNTGRRAAMVAVLGILLTGDARLLEKFLVGGRGHYAAAMAAIAAAGPASYGNDDKNDFEYYHLVEQYYIAKLHLPITRVPFSEWCATPPGFLIIDDGRHAAPAPSVSIGPAACVMKFDQPRIFTSWGLSSTNWIVYKRVS